MIRLQAISKIVWVFLILWGTAHTLEARDKYQTTAQVDLAILTAQYYLGTPYAFGGLDREGIDCSGLMVASFTAAEVQLPRTAKDQSKAGSSVGKKSLRRGDLVFFATGRKKRKVTHVGMVVSVNEEDVWFIHASSTAGVIISQLSDPYWDKRYLRGRRIIKGKIVDTPGDYPQLSERFLDADEVFEWSEKEKMMAQAEILARHGYEFPTRKVQKAFKREKWYKRLPKESDIGFVLDELSPIEEKNYNLLSQYSDWDFSQAQP
ncbi:MAG: NlpC/P60 family protein [Bacteroidota bacterium]